MTGTARALAVAAAAIVVVTSRSSTRAAATCPDWLRQAAALALTDAQKSSPAVVLLDEEASTVSASGEMKTRRRYAAKVMTVEGREAASLREVYLTDTGRVKEMRGWVIRPSGDVRELGGNDIVDLALVGNDVYNEVRQRRIGLGSSPEAGIVFGAEVTTESRSLFAQVAWDVQDEWPVARVVRSLTLPAGWRSSCVTFNRAPVEPVVAGDTWTWSLRDLPRIAVEPASPPWSARAPRLAVSFAGAPSATAGPPAFGDWAGASRWLAGQSEAAAVPDAAVRAAARELAGSRASEFERITNAAAMVQRIQYVSIQVGVGRGGGYRPRPAAEVLAKGHGDCKDKATLLRALLNALGVRSYLVAVFAFDPTYVRDTWPSPHQFNHVIVAIPVSDPRQYAAGVDVPGIGPVLLFDPTDPFTPLGQLPVADQGGFGLVVSVEGGPLVRMPEVEARANRFERTIEATVDAAGQLTGTLREQLAGGPAASARGQHRRLSAEAYRRGVADRVSLQIPRALLSSFDVEDDEAGFRMAATVTAPGFAQVIQGRLVLVRCPTPLARSLPALTESTRRTAIALQSATASEVLILAPGRGLRVDELPTPLSTEGPYGSYRLAVRREGERVIVERDVTTRRVLVPAADYRAVRQFIEGARAVDAATIVLARAE